MFFLFESLRYSINKRLSSYKEHQVWKKYGNRTKYHLTSHCFEIGEFTHGTPTIYQYDKTTKLIIGNYSSLASGVKFLLGGEHHIHRVSTISFYQDPQLFPNNGGWTERERGNIVVGNDVWIGRDAFILSGITIGDGAIIGAGTVVAKDIPPYAIAVGNPAKVIKYRFNELQIAALMKIRWWNWPVDKVNEYLPDIISEDIDGFITKILGDNWLKSL